jgi:type I restriction enzyme S subunit
MKNNMKEDWIECELGEVAQLINGDRGKNYPSRQHYVDKGIPFITAGNLFNGKIDTNSLNYISQERFDLLRSGKLINGDIIYCLRGTLGKLAIFSNLENGAIASSLAIIRLKNDILIDYIYLFLDSPLGKQLITKFDNGTAQPNLSGANVLKFSIPLAPLPIQRAIVSKIEALFSDLDNGIANFKKAQEQLKVYRQAVLKKAFEGGFSSITNEELGITNEELRNTNEELGITNEELRIRNEENQENHTNQKNHSADNLPEGWKWLKISDIANVVRGGSPRPAGDPKYYDGDIPFLKVRDITKDNGKYLNTFEYTIKEAGLHKTRQIKPNTLLLSNSGATLGVPKICMIEATMNDGIAAFLNLDERSNLYLYYFWESKTKELRNINMGAAQPNLNTDIIKNYLVPYCTFEEQTQIVQEIESRLSVTDNLEFVIRDSIEKAEALRQSILKKAFEGKLLSEAEIEQCKKEADYEPAGELLKKITNGKLRMTNGKLQMTNEKLRMTNEKLQMTNGKLRMTNEKLRMTNK